MNAEELAKLSDEEKRIKIAEICGYTFKIVPSNEEMEEARTGTGRYEGFPGYPVGGGPLGGRQERWWKNPSGKWENPPNYLNDLNAMHDAEKFLVSLRAYASTIQDIAGNHIVGYVSDYQEDLLKLYHLLHATARQRADAFLLVMG